MSIFDRFRGSKDEEKEKEAPVAEPGHQEKRGVHVVRGSGKIEKWDKALIFEHKVVLNTKERQQDGSVKDLTKEVSRDEFDVVNFLGQLRDQEKYKAIGLSSEADAQRDERIKELGEAMRQMSEGNTGETRAFLEEEALKTAKDWCGINEQNIAHLIFRLKRENIDLQNKTEELAGKLTRQEQELEKRRRKEPEIVEGMEREIWDTRQNLKILEGRKENFDKVRQVIDLWERLGRTKKI